MPAIRRSDRYRERSMSAAALLHLPGLRIVVSGLVRVPDRFHPAPPSEAKSVYSPWKRHGVRRGTMQLKACLSA